MFLFFSGPCTAWNLTIHEYSRNGDPAGPRLHTFCSRDTYKNFTLPWKTNIVVVRWVLALSLLRFGGQISRKLRGNFVHRRRLTTVTRHFSRGDYDTMAWIMGAIYTAGFCVGERANLKIDRPERFIHRPMGNRSRPRRKIAERLHLSWFCVSIRRFLEREETVKILTDITCKSLVKNRFLFFFFFFLKCKKLRLSLVLIESGLRMMMHIRIIYQTPLRVAYKNLWSLSICIYLLFMLDKNLEESLLNVIRSIGGFI